MRTLGKVTRLSMRRQVILCSLLVLLVASRAWAVDPSRHISQYAHTAWRIQDGFLGALPRAITQTADGYLWIGTENGLVRFDGVRFVAWTPPSGTPLPSPTVVSLLGSRDGSLWIGTNSGLSRWKHGQLTSYPGRAWITSIVEDRGGRVWFTRSPFPAAIDGALCQIVADGSHCYGKADGLPLPSAHSVVEDGEEGLWIGSDYGLAHWQNGSFALSSPRGPVFRQTFGSATALASSNDRSLWVGSLSGGIGLGQLVDGRLTPIITPELDGRTVRVNALLRDREQAVWVGTVQGLIRIHGGRVERFLAADGLSSDLVHGLYEDREGNLWTATSKGIDCFRNLRVSTFSAREGFIPGDVDSLL
ncbi:MAG: two-component regulator propeller domain-containing protein, partial [Vicinamibacterales bacterium]